MDSIYAELEKIRLNNDGMLDPHAVVMEAQPESHPLHNYFEWDNSKAAHAHRIWQARQLISCTVIIIPETNEKVTAYVSLREDRGNGGYRSMQEVLTDDELKAKMLKEALSDLEAWRIKYQSLKNLNPIFKAYDRMLKHA
jgi:predicted TIM-barrel fold metal-dependent hydrolase